MFFLIRSMNTHLRKVPASFDKPDPADERDPAEDSSAGEGSGGARATEAGTDGEPTDPQR
jgi:hypothetical protein